MKHLYKYVLIAVMMLVASCKDVIYELPDGEKYNHLYILQAVDSPASKRLVMQEEAQILHYSAFYSGYEAPNDIDIRFEVQMDLVAQYNESFGTEYEPMPEGSWQLEFDKAFIPAGGCRTELMDISVYTTGYLTPLTEYMLPIVMSTDDVKVSKEMSVLYYVISATSYVPSVLVSEDVDGAIADAIEMFSFKEKCLITRSSDGNVRRYRYDDKTDKFGTPAVLLSDWTLNQVKMIAKGPGTAVNVCNMYNTWVTYEWGEEAAEVPQYAGYQSVITGGTDIFKSIVPNCPNGLLAVIAADNSLRWYGMSDDGHSLNSSIVDTKGFNFSQYKQLFYYGSDLIGIDALGDMWLHAAKSNNGFNSTPTKIGSGWGDFTHVVPFGTDMLVRTQDGRLYKYEFDLRGYWDL